MSFERNILQQADDFFEAYRRCSKGENPRKDEYNRLCFSVVNVPAVVNAAFSIELYLKSILKSKEREHRLEILFNKLNIETQEQIKKAINAELSKNNIYNFDECLSHISNVFVEWRYIYEDYHTDGFYGCYITEFIMFFNLFLPILSEIAHKENKA